MKLTTRFIQYAFFVLFILSVLAGFLLMFNQQRIAVAAVAQSIEIGDTSIEEELQDLRQQDSISMTTAIVSMLATLGGFTVSAVVNFRKDRREAQESKLTLQQKEIELQKALLELEKLKKQTGN